MKRIPLGRDKFALIDDEDYERVSQHRWGWMRATPTLEYAIANIRVNGKRKKLRMARFILQANAPQVDHIDHNGLNNQKANLRPCSTLENARNRRPKKHSNPFKGVSLFNKGGPNPWSAVICIAGKNIALGYFSDPADAARAYDRAAAIHFGAFATTNQGLGLL